MSLDLKTTESGSESLPINDTRLNRFLVLAAIKILKRVRPHVGNVLLLSRGLCIKRGELINLSEASTLRYVSTHTSIPVPRVYCAFQRGGWTYILMERIRGDIVGRGWVKRSEESKAKILSQTRLMVEEMRRLVPPQGCCISNVDGGSLYDCRVSGPSLRFGPFSTIQDFHSHLRGGIYLDPRLDSEIQELIHQHQGDWPLKFTHGDLSSLNILACGDEVVGIVDWETAGWYPSYWEYTTACQVNPRNYFWRNEIDKFLVPMPMELAMEKIRQKYFGPV